MTGAAFSLGSLDRSAPGRPPPCALDDEEQRPNVVRAPSESLALADSPPRVLLVEHDDHVRAEVERSLRQAGYQVDSAADGREALALFDRRRPDLVVTEVDPPKLGDGELLRRVRQQDSELPIIVLSGAGDWRTAVTAMRDGARDYLVKPLDLNELSSSAARLCAERAGVASGKELASVDPEPTPVLGDLVGLSPPMRKVYALARRIARSPASVLITGETGTGKGRLARAIHDASARTDKPFVATQVSAFVESLLESELFGHERGSFTGADHRRIGRFEQANKGTLFLDEVGEMSQSVQVKLLRVLQEHELERVGGNEPIPVNVRVVAATSRDLRQEVEQGRFREDLYYRLNVVHIEMPPLRVRGDDILQLASFFLKRCSAENGKDIDAFDPRAEARLLGHPWAGNVRELENTIERAVVLCDGTRIDVDHLHLELPCSKARLQRLVDIEREAILSTLASTSSTARAADVLGISVRTLESRLEEYGFVGKLRKSR